MIDKGRCDDGFIWNPSTCECECDKSCDFSEYLDYVNCKCKKRLIGKLFQKCDEDIDENEMVFNSTLCDYLLNKKACRSCTRYVILLVIVFVLIISGTVFLLICKKKCSILL